MKTSLVPVLIAALASLALAGCSTTASRITSNPAAFAQATPQQQQLIQTGRIAVGFSKEEVTLALGDPDNVAIHTDANGTVETWSYHSYHPQVAAAAPQPSPSSQGMEHHHHHLRVVFNGSGVVTEVDA